MTTKTKTTTALVTGTALVPTTLSADLTKADAKLTKAQRATKAKEAKAREAAQLDSMRQAGVQVAGAKIAAIKALLAIGKYSDDIRDAFMEGYMARRLNPDEDTLLPKHFKAARAVLAKTVKARTSDETRVYGGARQMWSEILKAAQIQTEDARGGANNPEGKGGSASVSQSDKDSSSSSSSSSTNGRGRPKGSTGGQTDQQDTTNASEPASGNANADLCIMMGKDMRPVAPTLRTYDSFHSFFAFNMQGMEIAVQKNAGAKDCFVPVFQRMVREMRKVYEGAIAEIRDQQASLDALAQAKAQAEKAEAKPATTRAKRTAAAKNADTVAKATKGRRRTTK